MKTVYQLFNDEIFVKYEDDNYALKSNETLSDLSNFCKPKIENNEVIETATPQELSEWQKEKQLEQIAQMNAKFEQDGQAYYDEIKQRLTVMLVGKPNSMAIMAEIKQSIYPMLDQIKAGNYPFALLDYMDGQNNPTIPEVVDLFNEIGQYVNDYYTNEYPH